MTPWKRLFFIVVALILLFVLALAVVPFFFQDEIETRVKASINERVDARVEFGDVGLNLFRHFPNLAFSMNDLAVTGVGLFEGDTLAYVGGFDLVVDLRSAIGMLRRGDPLVVRSILVDRPYLHARVLEDGIASWDIMKALEEATAPEPTEAGDAPAVTVSLRRFAVEDGRVIYQDERTGLYARVDGLDHELSGDFSSDRFTLRSRTTASAVSLRHAGIPYLTAARMEADAELDADMDARRFVFRENRLSLNRLGLGFDGAITLLDDGADVDVTFAGDNADFRDILSLVPAVYTQDFESLEANGSVAVRGFVRGSQGPESVPSFALYVDVDDGVFRYPDLPLPVRGVFVDLEVANPASDLDSTTVELSRFELIIGDDPFRATLALSTPVSDPDLDASFTGTLDLESVNRAVKLEGVEELRGTVISDAAVRTRMSWLDGGEYDRVEATGRIEVRDMAVTGEAVPHPLTVDELLLELSPRHADLPVFRATAGSSDFRGSGQVDNLLGFVLRGEELQGRAMLMSRYIALDEWLSVTERDLEIIPVPGNLDLALVVSVDSMTFGDLVMTAARGDLRVADQRVTLDEFALVTLGGGVVMSGWYDTADPARPGFDFELAVADIDIQRAATFNTVRALAPAAEYAAGEFSADLTLTGILGNNLMPVLEVLDGGGGIRTHNISIRGMPVLDRLAEATRIDRLSDPVLSDFAASVEIQDGRFHVRPFDLRIGPAAVTVAGSNGIDRSLDYRLQLQLPRSALGTEANRVVAGLLERSGRAGVDLGQAAVVRLDAVVRGTVTDPAVSVEFGDAFASAGAELLDRAQTRLQQEADRRTEQARERVERAATEAEAAARERAAEARAQARARADSIIAEAEVQAERIRREAERAAENVRREADQQANRLVAEATNPVARRAAEVAGDRLRVEADQRATQLTTEADRRAEQLLDAARKRADAIVGDAITDEGSPDEGSPDEGSPDEGSPDEGSPDEGSPDVRPS